MTYFQSTNLKSKSKQKSLKYQENSKKQLYNVGILDSRWQEADFRKKNLNRNSKMMNLAIDYHGLCKNFWIELLCM